MNDEQLDYLDVKKLTTLDAPKAMATVLRWMGGDDERRRELALRICRRNAQTAVGWLLDELFAPGKRTPYRLLVLDALDQLGEPLPQSRFFDLSLALYRFGPVVAERVRQLLYRPPCTTPFTPGGENPPTAEPPPHLNRGGGEDVRLAEGLGTI